MEVKLVLLILLLTGSGPLLSLAYKERDWDFYDNYCRIVDLPPGFYYVGSVERPEALEAGNVDVFACPEDRYVKGSRTLLKCLSKFTWSDPDPRYPCVPIICGGLTSPSKGEVEVKSWEVYGEAVYSCIEGYWYDGTNPRICQTDTTWTGTVGQCTEVSCPPPAAPADGSLHPGPPYKYKAQLKVNCRPGFAYNGPQELVCLTNNSWSGTVGQCLDIKKIRCQPFQPLDSAAVTPWREEYNYKKNIHINCPKGFTYNGTRRRTCQVDGSWSGYDGSCNVKTCPPYVPVGVGWVEPACSPCEYRDTVRVVCPPGYNYNGTELTCDEHGMWKGTITECTGVPCDDDAGIAHGSINGSGFVYRDEVNIECDAGYRWEGASSLAVCNSNGNWTFTGSCIEIQIGTYTNNGKGNTGNLAAILIPTILAFIFLIILVYLLWQRKMRMNKQRNEISRRQNTNEGTDEENVPLQSKSLDPLKEAILKRGHVINRNPDKKINLDEQFVKLRLVTGEGYDRMDEINDALPDRYQDYLQREGAENIEIEDLLNYVTVETTDGVRKRQPLLMEGRAGVGKSTLVQKLMRLWAQNVWAEEYKAAFLFNIRNLTVHDKRKIPLVDLFRFYSLYTTKEGTGSLSTELLENEEENILVFIDGVDEFPGLQETLKDFERLSPSDEAEPMEWCINLLRRNVMGKSVLILASRPFKDLKHVNCSPILEVVGLTQGAIIDFIHHNVEDKNIERVKSLMKSNPLVMSVSAITYFCMMFCIVLEEDKHVSTRELTTYTRITAFFIEHYMKRCKSPDQRQMQNESSFLPPLTRLAYRGLIERYQMGNQVRLVFDQTDLEETGVTEWTRLAAEESGILITTLVDSPIAEAAHSHQMSEFVHLSIQELLAMLKLLQQSKLVTISAAYKMWQSGGFLMAQQYLFGLCYDQENTHIKKLLQTTGKGGLNQGKVEGGSHDLVQGLINRVEADKKEDSTASIKLQAIQMVYETQRQDVAGRVASVLFKENDEMFFHDTLLTAVDMNAIVFLLSQLKKDCKLRIEKVVMDVSSENVFAENISKCKTLRSFRLTETKLSEFGVKNMMNGLPKKQLLKELVLDNVGLYVEKKEHLGNALQQMSSLSKLSLEGSGWSEAGLKYLEGSLKKLTSLNELSLANAGMDDGKIDHIIAALKVINIMKLSLSGNKFGKQGIEHLADWLKGDTSLQHLNLANTGMGDDLVKILLAAVKTNKTLEALDICGEKMKYSIPALLDGNTTLSTLWFTDHQDETCTLVAVPDTGRRVEVKTGGDETRITAWCLEDITSSSCLHHHHTMWGQDGGKLALQLNDRYTDLYGAERPSVTTDTWSHTLNQLTSSTHRVGELVVYPTNSASLSPLLSSLAHDMIHTLIHSQVGRVEVYYGEVTCRDLLTWLSSLSSQPGWSVRAHVNGTEVTNTHSGQSVVIILVYTRVLASLHQKQQHQEHLGKDEIRLLNQPKWIIQ